MARLFLPLLLIPAVLAGCGRMPSAPAVATPTAATAARANAILRQVDHDAPLAKPVTARAVLEYGHTVARMIDAKAHFTALSGTRIGVEGTPVRGGEWQISYVGTTLPATSSNPYSRATRRITLTVPANGDAKLDVNESEGMPLGVCFLDSPMPAVDSEEALNRARQTLTAPATSAGYRLTLQGLMSGHGLARLVWKVAPNGTTQAADKPILLDAQSGDLILK